LTQLLVDPGIDFDSRHSALDCLEKLGADPVPPLLEALRGPTPEARAAAAVTVGLHVAEISARSPGDPGTATLALLDRILPALVEVNLDDDPKSRSAGSEALEVLGRDPGLHAVDSLLPLLSDAVAKTRLKTAAALTSMGRYAEAVQALTVLLGDPDPGIRRESLREFDEHHRSVEVPVPAIVKLIDDADPGIAGAAASLLGGLREGAIDAVPALKKRLETHPGDAASSSVEKAIRRIQSAARKKIRR